MLKPSLARGELRCIGATTLTEHRNHIEKDAALARRFQPVFVPEPDIEDTISIIFILKLFLRHFESLLRYDFSYLAKSVRSMLL